MILNLIILGYVLIPTCVLVKDWDGICENQRQRRIPMWAMKVTVIIILLIWPVLVVWGLSMRRDRKKGA
jgi:hypothetical protein